VTFNPRNRRGNFSKSAYIYSNATKKRIRLRIKGKIINKPKGNIINKPKGNNTKKEEHPQATSTIEIEWENIHFGDVNNNAIKKDTILVENTSRNYLIILFRKSPSYIKIKSEPRKIPPSEMGRIILTLIPDKKGNYGFFYDKLEALIINKNKSQKDLFVSGTILPSLQNVKGIDSAEFPDLKFSEKIKSIKITKNSLKSICTFEFKNEGKSNLIIFDIHLNQGCEVKDYSNLVEPGEKGLIEIVCDDVVDGEEYKKVIEIISNDPEKPQTSLRMNYKYID